MVKSRSGLSNANETEDISDPVWLLHDSIGYYFPDGGKLQLDTREKEGSWSRVVQRFSEEKLKAKIFNLWLDHGANPAGQTYTYVLVPHADQKVMEMMDKKFPFQIRNLKTRQEVISRDGAIGGVVFFEAGKSEIFGGIDVDQPCIVMVEKEGKKVQLSVADPTQKLAEIKLRIGKKAVLRTIALPQGGEAGKSVTVIL
jgi:chondroitin AC lyase